METMTFAYTQLRRKNTVYAGELREQLKLSAEQERKLLSRLAKAGVIARVWRGVYLVPSMLPLGGKWSPDEALVLNTLMCVIRFAGRIRSTNMVLMNRSRPVSMLTTIEFPASGRQERWR